MGNCFGFFAGDTLRAQKPLLTGGAKGGSHVSNHGPAVPAADAVVLQTFVDNREGIVYELREGKYLYKTNSIPLVHTLGTPVPDGTNILDVPESKKLEDGTYTPGFWDSKLYRMGGDVADDPAADDWFSIAQRDGGQIETSQFKNRFNVTTDRICHIKGFGRGVSPVYDEDILRSLVDRNAAVLVWDGDDPGDTSFTRIVSKFLSAVQGSHAVAFKKRLDIPKFNSRWYSIMAQFPGRIKVVPVDIDDDMKKYKVDEEAAKVDSLPKWAVHYFGLGRVALKVTGSKWVISMGGGGISSSEAQAAFNDGVHWTIYALSRGEEEKFPTLVDFAKKNLSSQWLTLVTGKDPTEHLGSCPEKAMM